MKYFLIALMLISTSLAAQSMSVMASYTSDMRGLIVIFPQRCFAAGEPGIALRLIDVLTEKTIVDGCGLISDSAERVLAYWNDGDRVIYHTINFKVVELD